MNLGTSIHGGHTVGHDPLYLKKSGFLSPDMSHRHEQLFFVIWIWLSATLRRKLVHAGHRWRCALDV